MCILKYFYYYFLIKNREILVRRDINYEWKNLDKKSGMCKKCCKYSDNLTENNELCYRCFENWFYENK
jgi:hypothetical protein